MPVLVALSSLVFLCTTFAAWVTHVLWIIGKLLADGGATAGQMVLGVLGAFIPPVGVFHGVYLWFC